MTDHRDDSVMRHEGRLVDYLNFGQVWECFPSCPACKVETCGFCEGGHYYRLGKTFECPYCHGSGLAKDRR